MRFTYALVRFSDQYRDLPCTYAVQSRHETLTKALRAFDRKHEATEAPFYALLELDRHGVSAGNGFMSIAAARACLA